MKNNEETASAICNKELNSATADTQEVHKPRFRNPDNHDLWHWDALPNGGDAPEVNGHWADEIQGFVPTSGELLALAEHWTDVAIQRTFVEWADAPVFVSTSHWRRVYFAWRRVYRIRALLGEVIDQLIEDRIKEFREGDGASLGPTTWEEFSRLIDRDAQKEHLAPAKSCFRPPS